ncbi:MAG: hypothetical protein GYA62_10255, partial [Bacteroidales bacterium]|nr:hypothetical protein [Bacteroidales bacterium]
PVYLATNIIKNYVTYFSPKFLFFNGGTQYQFSLPNHGLVYPACLPFFYVGLIYLIYLSFKSDSEENKNNFRMLLAWILISPIPASLTNESYAVIRATTMLPTVEIISAIGLYFVLDKIPKKYSVLVTILSVIFPVAIYLSAENYLYDYLMNYRINYSWSWQYGYKDVSNYINNNYNNYDKIIITKKYGEPHEFLLYYLKYDPNKYLSDKNKISFFQSNWWWVDRFDKFWFVNDWQVKLNSPELSSIQEKFITESKHDIDCSNSKCLLVTSPDNFPPGWKKVLTINFLDGKKAFELYTNN